MKSIVLLSLIISFSFYLQAQDTLHSKYGKSLPAYGTLRILIVYAEIEYDVNPEKDPQAAFSYNTWKKGQLPLWKDEMADHLPQMDEGKGLITRYYKESSFDRLTVLGDYVPFIVTVKESETNSSNQTQVYTKIALEKICNEKLDFVSANGYTLKDFDLWTLTTFGKPKITPSIDNPHKIDHLMIVYRNIHSLLVNNGFASQGSPSAVCSIQTDTYSTFSAGDHIPFNVSKHEYAHLILGDNNFHPYGNTIRTPSYFFFKQCGWSLLSAANATLLTCNSWDRDRLDWRAPGKNFSISVLDTNGNEISTDLDPTNSVGAGTYLLRDFVTTGDALRIKIPVFNQESKYPQWLWIENHQTSKNNQSSFDNFQYQYAECTDEATPGLYMFTQVSKNEKSGIALYGGYHNYLRPVLANGNYDWIIENEKVQNNCINDVWHYPFQKVKENPFTGSHQQEFPLFDLNNDGKIEESEEVVPAIERKDGDYMKKLGYLGDAGNAFTKSGNSKISIGTNPSTAPVINPEYGIQRLGQPVNRIILLNGISVEILEEKSNGTIKVEVKFDDTEINKDVRWCADTILLPKIKSDSFDLILKSGKKILLDQGLTTTRFKEPKIFNDQILFANPTVMECLPGTSIILEEKSQLIVENGSTLILNKDCNIYLEKGAGIVVSKGGSLLIDVDARIHFETRSKIKVDKSSNIHFNENSIVKNGKRIKMKIKGKKVNLEP